jgi:membrane-bound metal-dependent hydrolase YbcI (DUF457 family)
MIFAGTIADVDLVSALSGPAAYFAGRRTYTHSLVGTVAIILLALIFTRYLARNSPEAVTTLILPITVAAAVHVIFDLCQSQGVALFWPFRPTRFSLDWLPSIDPWILALLVGGILMPELLLLVSSEIGAKSRAPRGRTGAIVALILIAGYVSTRAVLHSSSLALLDPHSYHGESARNLASFPDGFSMLTWHAVVETQSLLCVAAVPMGPGRTFDPESAQCVNKPESSPALLIAQHTRAGREYLRVARIPRALVAKTEDGYEVVFRSMRDTAEDKTSYRVAVRVLLDSKASVEKENFIWASDIELR